MNDREIFLTEIDALWARMAMQVLEDNGIPCVAQPVHGAGFILKTGAQERLRIYVPREHKAQARELLQALFSQT